MSTKARLKRVSESEILKPERRKSKVVNVEDDFDAAISSDIKGLMSALQLIKEKAQIDEQKKKDETVSSVASEINSNLDEMKSKLEKERQTFAKALSKSSKECESLLKNETAKFQQVYDNFSKEKATHLHSLKDVIAKYEEEKERLFMRYEQLRKKEKTMLSEHEKAIAAKIAELDESLQKKKQGDKTFSMLRKSLGSFLGNASDEDD
ncbi:hypothetical protein ACJIZ3_006387 [Penstemon smallii]|uniref:DNA ligase 1 n=1 Tax=Penstemon smallii TaxID=265156 RepID=A0ABD3S7N5_9LAMI